MKSGSHGRPLVIPLGSASQAAEGEDPRVLLGTKGADLDWLAAEGYPTPPGFCLTAEATALAGGSGDRWSEVLLSQVRDQVARLERLNGHRLGDPRQPLLLAVRAGAGSGAILHIGLNDKTVLGLAKLTGHEESAWQCYRSFLEQFGTRVLGLSLAPFEAERERIRRKYKVRADPDLRADHLREIIEAYQKAVLPRARIPMVFDSHEQLTLAIAAVLRPATGSAKAQPVLVQTMVFGNLGPDSGSGRAFSHDPVTGQASPTGYYHVSSQGQDLDPANAERLEGMTRQVPAEWGKIHAQLLELLRRLEESRRHPQEVSFCVEAGRLWLLRSRQARRTASAGLGWAVDLAGGRDGTAWWTPREALATLTADDLREALGATSVPAKRPGRRKSTSASSPPLHKQLKQVLNWADDMASLSVLAIPTRAEEAGGLRALGSRGIGGWSCTDILLEPEHAWSLREAMLQPDTSKRTAILAGLLPALRREFETLFEAFGEAPVHGRLPDIDWGLLVPQNEREWKEASKRLAQPVAQLDARLKEWPRLRGARGLMALPELTKLVVQAGIEAAAGFESRKAIRPAPSWWLPGVHSLSEGTRLLQLVREVSGKTARGVRSRATWDTGWILQCPRAAMLADQFAAEGRWLVFDLAALQRGLLGLDRADVPEDKPEAWHDWLDTGRSFDMAGLGSLLQTSIRLARQARPDASFGAWITDADDVGLFRSLVRIGCDFVCVPGKNDPIARFTAALSSHHS